MLADTDTGAERAVFRHCSSSVLETDARLPGDAMVSSRGTEAQIAKQNAPVSFISIHIK